MGLAPRCAQPAAALGCVAARTRQRHLPQPVPQAWQLPVGAPSICRGFPRGEQRHLAVPRARASPQMAGHGNSVRLRTRSGRLSNGLCVLLRLAVVLHRRRSETPLPEILIKAERAQIKLRFPDGWLGVHQLTTADLETEARLPESRRVQTDSSSSPGSRRGATSPSRPSRRICCASRDRAEPRFYPHIQAVAAQYPGTYVVTQIRIQTPA